MLTTLQPGHIDNVSNIKYYLCQTATFIEPESAMKKKYSMRSVLPYGIFLGGIISGSLLTSLELVPPLFNQTPSIISVVCGQDEIFVFKKNLFMINRIDGYENVLPAPLTNINSTAHVRCTGKWMEVGDLHSAAIPSWHKLDLELMEKMYKELEVELN